MNYANTNDLTKKDLQIFEDTLRGSLQSDIALVNQISSRIINSGGKRIRPLLLILITKALKYDGNYTHIMAVVIELIHTATLLHDDVIDNSELRRGAKTVNASVGNEAAVLVGDFLYSKAFELMVEPDNMKIMKILANTTNKIAEGEIMQLFNVGKIDISESEYLTTIYKKTAVLFSATTNIAGILANSKHIDELISFGTNLGIMFQIIDDILDYTATPNKMGKKRGNDLAEGKITLPLIYIINRITNNEKKIITNAINDNSAENFEQIVGIINSYGGFDCAFNMAKKYQKLAQQNLDFMVNSDYKNALINLCKSSLHRKF